MNRPKFALCLDWCDTCTTHSSWKLGDAHLLSDAGKHRLQSLRAVYLPLLEAGTLTPAQYRHWMDETYTVYTGEGISRARLAEVFSQMRIRDGLPELLAAARENNVVVAVISAGTADFVELVAQRHNVLRLINRVHSARFTYNGDVITGVQKDTIVYADTKGDRALEFALEHGVQPSNILAVGDSMNDVMLSGPHGRLVGVAETEEKADKLRGSFHEVHVGHSLHPVIDSLKRFIGQAG